MIGLIMECPARVDQAKGKMDSGSSPSEADKPGMTTKEFASISKP